MAAFRGPRQDLIEERLKKAFPQLTHLEVTNESHGRKEDESHFHVVVVSSEFDGLKPIARHRLVNTAVSEEDGTLGFHSVRITAKAPSQWEANPIAPDAPKCSGGDGIPKR
eukprot:CAMPEP_0197859444 /NCGR_PEP_ID=MMETSP1438-20131217/33995_1 /TAXON_ID=1461541 /ORGANISM="Pterosperma sp., Strain CCMP1384" /LENGTH=110 /DNA_ID=CAMNT_0043475925 /DNA_START=245 /DNA_END=577 /DNA_ORIENTATION=+